ncbi:MAG TPA: rhomboid family intramembrane serine protease [Vicinamibacterales bacterium]|nr:rhomboid family intramembrane serine protease [Vicinamibacterales bacterium]
MSLLVLALLLGFAWYVMKPEERSRVIETVLGASRYLPTAVKYAKHAAAPGYPEPEPFLAALNARTPRALVTPAIVALNVTVFAGMIVGAGSIGDPETLVRWGASFGPRTTNGEWTRLLTSMFVHAGPLHLVVSLAALVHLGFVMERLVGHVAFAAVYVAAGTVASLVSLSNHPIEVSAGASGAVFGIYGLLVATSIWGLLQRSPLTIPVSTLKNLAPPAALFFLYNAVTEGLGGGAELSGLIVGFACGLLFARSVADRKPPARQVAAAMAATLVIVAGSAVPLRGLTDVRPEIERALGIEDRTAGTYRAAVEQFRYGNITADGLADLIDRKIVPEISAVRARLKALGRVPEEHRPLVDEVEEYLRLRDESWRLRSEALHRNDMNTLRKADRAERASLDAFERLKPVDR